jgi:hypothetical protein
MTYKIDPNVKLIACPVITVIDGKETLYENGTALSEVDFDKYYVITRITARDNIVVLEFEENKRINDITWIGEEAVSFF